MNLSTHHHTIIVAQITSIYLGPLPFETMKLPIHPQLLHVVLMVEHIIDLSFHISLAVPISRQG